MEQVIFIKHLNKWKKILLFIIALIIGDYANAKIIHAKDFQDAIRKIEKKKSNGPLSIFLGTERKYMLACNSFYWDYDSQKEDTIYICQVRNYNSAKFDEYIATTNRIYSIRNRLGSSLECKIYGNTENTTRLGTSQLCKLYDNIYDATDIPDIRYINYVKSWDVALFEKWDTTRMNDFTHINAVRIIKVSKHRFKYDYYSFYDNSFEDSDPFEGCDPL